MWGFHADNDQPKRRLLFGQNSYIPVIINTLFGPKKGYYLTKIHTHQLKRRLLLGLM